MTNLNAQIQTLSAMRNDLYEQAGAVSLSNPGQAKALWAAADLLVKSMDALDCAKDLELKAGVFTGNPFDALMA